MNAFGDATMALALFLLIQQTGSLDFAIAFSAARGPRGTVANLVALGLLGGAVAKSAQLPLQTWLPDAMEGPTPGQRPHPRGDDGHRRRLPDRAHDADLRARAAACRTSPPGSARRRSLMAGLIALVQTDIKRVIAYSTMSQIGYMFLGVGLGAYANGDVPPDDARLLQGAALPRGRDRHPRARRRAGHAARWAGCAS